MLVLSRRKHESIRLYVGGIEVQIMVTEFRNIRGDKPAVRLSFDAPQSVVIVREELLTKGEAGKLPPPASFDVGEPLPEDAWNRSIEAHELETP